VAREDRSGDAGEEPELRPGEVVGAPAVGRWDAKDLL
jgi:hypothetical protein